MEIKIHNHKEMLECLLSGRSLKNELSSSILSLNDNWLEWNDEVVVESLHICPSVWTVVCDTSVSSSS